MPPTRAHPSIWVSGCNTKYRERRHTGKCVEKTPPHVEILAPDATRRTATQRAENAFRVAQRMVDRLFKPDTMSAKEKRDALHIVRLMGLMVLLAAACETGVNKQEPTFKDDPDRSSLQNIDGSTDDMVIDPVK